MSDPSPPLRPFARGLVRAQTAQEAADFDRRAIDGVGVPEPVLMENAGRSAALVAGRLLLASDPSAGAADPGAGRRVVVALVGSGNNGGDALVALRSFAAWGYPTKAILVGDRTTDDPLLHGWGLEVVEDTDLDDDALVDVFAGAALVLDGILGTGARGAPRDRQARVIEALNRAGSPVAALDIPSGADATTGAVPGSVVRSDLTVSFGAPKVGSLLHPARAHVGRQVAVEIGFPPMIDDDAAAFVATPSWVAPRLPLRDTDTHKNRVGRVVVVGGGPGMAGAAILAARAAFRAGAGLVHVATAGENREAIHGAVPEAMVVAWGDDEALKDALARADAVVAGPGLGTGDEARRTLTAVFGDGDGPLVLDADALNLVAENVAAVDRDAGPGARHRVPWTSGRSVLLTPHPGEMARLLPESGDRAPAARARRAAEAFGCTVLLKGAPSVVARTDGALAVDSQSSSDLAVAGMGDTLSGVCGALLAQGLDAADAGAVALYLSGRGAVLAHRGTGLTPSDVVEALPDALAELEGGASPITDVDFPFVLFDADPAR